MREHLLGASFGSMTGGIVRPSAAGFWSVPPLVVCPELPDFVVEPNVFSLTTSPRFGFWSVRRLGWFVYVEDAPKAEAIDD